jgi:ParB-like chromosome segregation protein Spo0J
MLDVPLDTLHDSSFQVKRYDDARLRDLAEIIRKQGLLRPARVRRVGDGDELIFGHARRAACPASPRQGGNHRGGAIPLRYGPLRPP